MKWTPHSTQTHNLHNLIDILKQLISNLIIIEKTACNDGNSMSAYMNDDMWSGIWDQFIEELWLTLEYDRQFC